MKKLQYWLLKTEPDVFSIDDLMNAPSATTGWEGVRNYQARNYLLQMKKGDFALIYHSNKKPQHIAGVAKIVREAYVDPTQFLKGHRYYDKRANPTQPIWYQVDVQGIAKAKNILTLQEIKKHDNLKEMVLLKNSRLSVQPLKEEEFRFIILKLGLKLEF